MQIPKHLKPVTGLVYIAERSENGSGANRLFRATMEDKMDILAIIAAVVVPVALLAVALLTRQRQRNEELRRHIVGRVPSVTIRAPDTDGP